MRPVEALLAILRDEGVDKIFGNPGTTELPLLDALAAAPDIEYVLAVQEMSAVAMADGYARATGRPAFVNLHVAAGLANGLIGMLNAKRSRIPLVVTAGQQDRRHLVEDPMLSGDLVGLAAAASKHAVEVQHAHDLPIVLRRAFALAAQPPAGPVFVSIPMDLLADGTDVTVPPASRLTPPGPATGIDEAAAILAGARRPAVVAGDGVGREDAVAELVAVAERLGAAVYPQPMHDAVNFPGDHPLNAGMPAPRNAAVREALDGHDVVFVVGSHAFSPHHYTPGSPIPDGTRVVQLDSDPAEPGRNFPVELGLVGGVRPSLARLAAALDGRVSVPPQQVRRPRVERPRTGRGPIDPAAAAHAIADALPPDAVVVDEAITIGVLLRPLLRLPRPGGFVHTVGGGLGWGIGAAIGSRLGRPDRPVVAVLGDGCAMFGLQGLWSAARYRVPVAFLVMNNGEYRTLKDTLAESGSTGPHPGLDLTLASGRLDWTNAAAFFGVRARRVDSAAELREVVAGAGRLDAPLLVDVPILDRGGG
ncbi:MAG TPA: thiamine pyrophosphate-binding protein [Actinophytocola sp.]|jgi:benzoylformate decarboxylase|uniref:thiamine pyrophosphate-binding protein n=1 Tax=Actinophytocola sp. TaxID=1872138 RepID=UPI002F93718B